MRKTYSVQAEEWVFARPFAYVSGQMAGFDHYVRGFRKRRYQDEPHPDERVPYLSVEEDKLLVYKGKEPHEWLFWTWEDTKSIRIYTLMHPWKASIYPLFQETERERERRRSIRYFRHMKTLYPNMPAGHQETYESHYGLLLEGRSGNGQIWVPHDWLSEGGARVLTHIEEASGQRITYFDTDEPWQQHTW